MKTFTFALLMTGLVAAPALYADCPVSLPHDKIIDCIVKENATGIREKELFDDKTVSKQQGESQFSPPSDQIVDLQAQK